MPFMLIISELLTFRFASAMASGCGLFAAHSFQSGDDARGFGAPVAVSRLLFMIVLLKGVEVVSVRMNPKIRVVIKCCNLLVVNRPNDLLAA
jgi:hypothetical protein